MKSMVVIRHYERFKNPIIEERRFFDDPKKAIKFVAQFNSRNVEIVDDQQRVPNTYLLADQPMRVR